MIIDTHTHFYDPGRAQGVPWPAADAGRLYRTVLPDDYQALAEPEGISGTVVVEASSWLEDNQWILDLAQTNPIIVAFVGHLEPGTPAFKGQLLRFSSTPLFRGIRCNGSYFDDSPSPVFLEDMERLAAHDLTLDVLVRPKQFESVRALAQAIPQLRIVVNHIGHMPITGESIDEAWQEGYARLAESPQIYIKVSALPEQCPEQPAPTGLATYRPTLDLLWQLFGSRRLIYGSNWPVCERAGDFALGLNVVKQYFGEKGDIAYDRFFRQNAQTVYKIPSAGWREGANRVPMTRIEQDSDGFHGGNGRGSLNTPEPLCYTGVIDLVDIIGCEDSENEGTMLSERHQLSQELAFVTRFTEDDELSILSRALDLGIDLLFRQTAERAYVDEKLSRSDAVDILGDDRVGDLDYARQSLIEDISRGHAFPRQ